MHDIKQIRSNPAAFDAGLARRGLPAVTPQLLALDEQKRTAQTALQELLSKRNGFAKQIGMAKSKGEDASAIMEEAKQVNETIAAMEGKLAERGELETLLETIPNLPTDDVPEGTDEHAN